ncbi:MAG: 4-alpha-glucanotransferase, partial [Alphaproteobacteria bacterium]|nr:4-alpha-glucanotransferase [Alphaproteobacteria bacterium]
IELEYYDVYGGLHVASTETKRALLAAMGFSTDTDAQIRQSLGRISDAPWRRMLEPITIVRHSPRHQVLPEVSLYLPHKDSGGTIGWTLTCEDGAMFNGSAVGWELSCLETRELDGETYSRLLLKLPVELPLGYHELKIETGAHAARCSLVVAPHAAYAPRWMKEHRRVWGVACQLYSLCTDNDWGIGDFRDLSVLCEEAGKAGAGAVGLSPLHALFPMRPNEVSPYSPSSRLFFNPIYIDITAVPEYQASARVRKRLQSKTFQSGLTRARASERVAYGAITALKAEALGVLFDEFQLLHPEGSGSERRRAFEDFVCEGGERLHRFAVFEALQEHFGGLAGDLWGDAYRDPNAPAVLKFAEENARRIEFFIYQQWEADRQLAAAAAACKDAGMDIGLYCDLAVGVAAGGADAWIDPDAFVLGARFGAPPDPLAPAGQDWGMPPFNPVTLRENAYGPYIDMLRDCMRHAGAVRIDHAMWMQHMFWIPLGGKCADGAYVQYPMDDLFAILALESVRNRCMVVGEDLGTVPEGFSERMEAENILSYRLMHFQRYANGLYFRPDRFPRLSLAMPGSHDMPTIAGFWTERDLHVQKDIGLLSGNEAFDKMCTDRQRDREMMVAALQDQGLVDDAFPHGADLADEELKILIVAVHRFLARSPAALMMINLDDAAVSSDQVNVPGTVDEHPNWRHRLHIAIETLAQDPLFADLAEAVKTERAAVA